MPKYKDKKKIYVLGTCRAFDLVKSSANHLFLLNREGVLLHSTKEILNIINIHNGLAIPKKLHKHLTINRNDLKEMDKADIFVVEIASNRCIKFENYYFKFYKSNFKNPRDHVYIMREKEIIEDMAEICRKLKKPVVFIPHISVFNKNGTPVIPQRESMRKIVENGAKVTSKNFFDPGKHMKGYWKRYVDKELYHYTSLGKKKIGNIFKEYLLKEKL